jgi:predicted nucleic acid-binding protein
MITIDDALAGVTRLGCDTSPIIYFIEAHPDYDERVTNLFQRIANGTILGFTSAITLSEVLIHPLRHGNLDLQHQYRDLLLHSGYFWTLSITPPIAERGADIRNRYGLRLPDALQIAASLSAGCEVFLTNDTQLHQVTELRVLVLGELQL